MTGKDPPYRPELVDDTCPQHMSNLIVKCWQESPEARPSFTEIKKMIKESNKNK